MNKTTHLACIFAALLALPLLAAAQHSGATKKAPPAPPVVVAEVESGGVQAKLWYSGGLQSRDEADLAAESEGLVVEVAEIGERVEAGAVVVRLDDTLLSEELRAERANITGHAARLEFLERDTARLGQLIKNNTAALSRYEERQSEFRMASAEHAASQARARRIQELIHRMTVVAPYAGVVQRRHVEVGEWAGKGDALLGFVGSERLEVRVGVAAHVLSHIRVGDAMTVKVDDVDYSATLRAIVAAADHDTRLFELRLDMPAHIGLPGRLVSVAVPVETKRDAVFVPEDALVIRGDSVKVFIVGKDMAARAVPVVPGLSSGARIEVVGDLQAGQKVVVRGGERLRDGVKVRFVEPVKSRGTKAQTSPGNGKS